MRFSYKKFSIVVIIITLLVLCLLYPTLSAQLAAKGLLQWYQKIVPVIFPFMLLTSVLRLLGMDEILSSKMKLLPYLFPKVSGLGHYVIIIGFLCGFPMGAKVVCELYLQKKLRKKEAQFLLCFCNNISPAFFLGVVYPVILSLLQSKGMHILEYQSFTKKIPYIFCMYGIPLLYGLLFQHFFLSGYIDEKNKFDSKEKVTFVEAINLAMTQNILPLVKIGGYMVIFQICSMLPILIQHFLNRMNPLMLTMILSGLEITNGLCNFYTCISYPLPILLSILFFCLQFGGCSCIMQTTSFLVGTDLSLKNYIFHKIMIGLLAAVTIYCFTIACI